MSTTAFRRTRRDPLDVPLKVTFPFWVIGSALLVLFPLYLIFMVSFAPGSAVFGERPQLAVTSFTTQWWKAAFQSGGLTSPLIKSLAVASVTTLLAILIAAPAAYVISRLRPAIRYSIVIGLLVTRMFPEFAIGISVATRFAKLGLLDTYVGLILAHLIGSLPFIAWILVGTFETIPIDLEEAAQIDGASRLGTLVRVVFPVAAGGIAVASLFVWLYSWNEFLYARLLTTNQLTLPLKVFQAIDRGTTQQMATVAAILTLPILLVVYFLQRYLRPGALTGAVKG
ncbi:MAG: carbohydrate ABC transporter permease [Actinobacteria bacterium]|nr:MAG: carbohydrate ABC transporter permease [Actinomycetota bacterium]